MHRALELCTDQPERNEIEKNNEYIRAYCPKVYTESKSQENAFLFYV